MVVTGSGGKTTLLHLIESQLGDSAVYSHRANSAFGIPLHILGLKGIQNSRKEYPKLLFLAPFKIFAKLPKQEIYVTEVDADRPNEAKFLAKLLNPEVTLWVSAGHSHAQGFDHLVTEGEFKDVDDAIAFEYSQLARYTSGMLAYSADNQRQKKFAEQSYTPKKIGVSITSLAGYDINIQSTTILYGENKWHLPGPQPRNVFYQLAMLDELLSYLGVEADNTLKNFSMPVGRSSVWHGKKDTIIIDSTYNNPSIDALSSMIEMFSDIPHTSDKWAVVGDLMEQGQQGPVEHEKIVKLLESNRFDRLILVGPQIAKYTYPSLSDDIKKHTEVFEVQGDALNYVQENLQGGEMLFVKGIRYLEGLVGAMLADESQADQLIRRGESWDNLRKGVGL